MLGNILNFFKWAIIAWKGDLKLKTARGMIYLGFLLIGTGFTLNFYYKGLSFILYNEAELPVLSIGVVLIIFGMYLIYKRYKELEANPPYILYVRGMQNMDTNPPLNALPPNDRSARQMVFQVDSYDKKSLLQEYGVMKHLVSQRVENGNASRLYVAGLGSFPMQFLIGALIRNAYSVTTQLLDFDRIKNRWYILEDFSTGADRPTYLHNGAPLDVETAVNKVLVDNPTDVGIALAHTFDIPDGQLPPIVREHTIILKLSCGNGHDLVSSTALQRTLLDDISRLLRALSSDGRKVHIFAAAQSSFCIALGKSYMDNAHGTLVLYNYNHNIEGYDWSVEFCRGSIVN